MVRTALLRATGAQGLNAPERLQRFQMARMEGMGQTAPPVQRAQTERRALKVRRAWPACRVRLGRRVRLVRRVIRV